MDVWYGYDAKKGLHLNMIHNVDRPFSEMMLGLESYIPMYMTGQISPYYIKGIQNSVFCIFLKYQEQLHYLVRLFLVIIVTESITLQNLRTRLPIIIRERTNC